MGKILTQEISKESIYVKMSPWKCKLKLQCDTIIYPPEWGNWKRSYVDPVYSFFGKLLINCNKSFLCLFGLSMYPIMLPVNNDIMLHVFWSSVIWCINIYDYYILLINLLLFYYEMTLPFFLVNLFILIGGQLLYNIVVLFAYIDMN